MTMRREIKVSWTRRYPTRRVRGSSVVTFYGSESLFDFRVLRSEPFSRLAVGTVIEMFFLESCDYNERGSPIADSQRHTGARDVRVTLNEPFDSKTRHVVVQSFEGDATKRWRGDHLKPEYRPGGARHGERFG